MKQVLFRIPGLDIPVYGFGVMVVLGFYVALLVCERRCRRERLDSEILAELAVWMLLGGLVGARAFYVIEYWGERVHTVGQIFKVWEGGVVFYGGFLGGMAGLAVFRLIRAFPLLPMLDAIAPSIALGSGIGRIGCFLNGCCYGDVCSIPWLSARFPAGSPPWLSERARGLIEADAPHSLPLHPTQLYAAVDGLALFALLTAFYPNRRRDGEVVAIYLLAYPVTRFLIERLRDDEPAVFLGLTISQSISLALFTTGLALWAWLLSRPRGRWADTTAAESP